MMSSTGEWVNVEAFYTVTYPRLVATLAMVRCSREEAEELVQEAFVRLLPRWETVRGYEDPEGWVRSVAMRLATSRWRRTRTAAVGVLRLRPAAATPPPNEDGILVRDLLAELSLPAREVLVLHYGLGMRVSEMAQTLGIAEGTVKSRLARARDAARLSSNLNVEDYNG